jgi:uncharacterized protein (TIRG00374 family)
MMPSTSTTPKSSRLKLRSIGLSILGGCIFVLLVHFGSRELLAHILNPDLGWLTLMVIVLGGTLFVFTYRLKLIADSLAGNHCLSPWRLYFYNVSSLAIAIFVPQTLGIFAVRAAALTRQQSMSAQKSITAVIFDKLFDALIMLVFAWPGLLLVLNLLTLDQAVLISFVEIGVLFVLLVWRYTFMLRLIVGLLTAGLRIVERLPLFRRIGQWPVLGQLQNMQEWDLLQQRTILLAFIITVLGQMGLVFRSWFIANAIGLNVGLKEVCIGVALAQLMQLIAFTPGALGFVEAAWYITFASIGVTVEQVLAFAVAHRVFENLAVALIWVVLYFSVFIASHVFQTGAVRSQNEH